MIAVIGVVIGVPLSGISGLVFRLLVIVVPGFIDQERREQPLAGEDWKELKQFLRRNRYNYYIPGSTK